MMLTVRTAALTHSEPAVILNSDDCLEMGVSVTDRVMMTGVGTAISSVVVSDSPGSKGFGGLGSRLMERLSVSDGDWIAVVYSPPPESIRSIRA